MTRYIKHSSLAILTVVLAACSPAQSEFETPKGSSNETVSIADEKGPEPITAIPSETPAQPEFWSYAYFPGQAEIQARVRGTLTVENGCFVLNMSGTKVMPQMPADVTRWDSATGNVIFAGRVYPRGTPIITNGGGLYLPQDLMTPEELGVSQKCILPSAIFMGTQMDDSYYMLDLAPSDPGLLEAIAGDWVIQTIDGSAPEFASRKPHYISFNTNGTIQGYDGCNRFNLSYNLLSEIAHFSRYISTVAGCGENERIVSDALMALLRDGNRFSREGEVVRVTSGKKVCILEKAPASINIRD